MLKQDRDDRQRLPRGLQRLLMKAALILQQLAEQPATVLRLVFQEQADVKPDPWLVFQGHREDQVRAGVRERVFFRFEFGPVKREPFFLGKDQVKEFQGKVGIGIKLFKEHIMVAVAFLWKGVRVFYGRGCHNFSSSFCSSFKTVLMSLANSLFSIPEISAPWNTLLRIFFK